MKTISKKIKSIYLLAMMAIISVCIAVFPVFKTEMVNAEEVASDFCVKGAYIKVDTDLEKEDVSRTLDNFALMFQARFSAATYTAELASQNVRFGLAIGPATNFTGITDKATLEAADVEVFDDLVGTPTSEATQKVRFAEGQEEYTYEAGVYFNKNAEDENGDPIYTGSENWSLAYEKELAAMPFYIIVGGGEGGTDAYVFAPVSNSTTAKQATIATMMAETSKPANTTDATPYKLKRAVSDKFFTMMTGKTLTREHTDDHEIYLSQTKEVFLADFGWGEYRNNTADGQAMNQSFLRYWVPSTNRSTSSGSGKNMYPVGSYVAGTTIIKAFGGNYNQIANVGLASAQARLADTTAIDKLIPGETYRMYRVDSSGNYLYFNYKVISGAIMAQNYGSAHDLALTLSAKPKSTSGNAFMYTSYFALDTNQGDPGEFYMPYGRQNNQMDMNYNNGINNDTGYSGYYILGGDLVVDDPINNYKSITKGYALSALRSFAYQGAITNKLYTGYKTVGAMKQVQVYTVTPNTAAIENSNVGFTGVFDGRGHTISTSFGRGGLFGYINGGTVKNLNIKADFYQYDPVQDGKVTVGTKEVNNFNVVYDEKSYGKNSAVLAETVVNGSTIENVQIELVESAPKTFNPEVRNNDSTAGIVAGAIDMNNVTAIFAAYGVHGEDTMLKNVIVKCDTLKDVGYSRQNYRAALNIDSDVQAENLFVIGSSYTNMSIDDDYTLTISTSTIPAGFEAGVAKPIADDSTVDAKYRQMIIDMYKSLRNEDVSGQVLKIKFVEEKATGKFINNDAFVAYLAQNPTVVEAFVNGTGNGNWAYNASTGLDFAWKPVLNTTYTVTAPTTSEMQANGSGKFNASWEITPAYESIVTSVVLSDGSLIAIS